MVFMACQNSRPLVSAFCDSSFHVADIFIKCPDLIHIRIDVIIIFMKLKIARLTGFLRRQIAHKYCITESEEEGVTFTKDCSEGMWSQC